MVLGPVKRNPEGGLEAWVTTQVLDDAGELQQCEVIVDTGFTGWLTLPVADIRRLGLVHSGLPAQHHRQRRIRTLCLL